MDTTFERADEECKMEAKSEEERGSMVEAEDLTGKEKKVE